MSNYNHNHNNHGGSTENFMAKIEFLDSAMRQRTLPPEEILNMLPMQKEVSVLDLGAGSGYLTIPAAKQTEGTVFALDMDGRMLQVIDKKAKAQNIFNIQLIEGNIEGIPLPDNSVNIAIASLILHEVSSLSVVFAEINRVLKTGGHLLCLEYEKKESSEEGPPMHIRIPSVDMEQALYVAGFEVEQKTITKESIYILTAKKTGGTGNGNKQ